MILSSLVFFFNFHVVFSCLGFESPTPWEEQFLPDFTTPKTQIEVTDVISEQFSENETTLPSDVTRGTTEFAHYRNCGTNKYMKSGFFDEVAGRIIGGYNAAPNEFPWMVFLSIYSRSEKQQHTCGGSLVSSSWVLSSSSCCAKATFPSDIRAYIGGNRPDDFIVTVNCTEAVLHPDFNFPAPYNYDYCLIQLPNPVEFIEGYISPICLPDNCEDTCQPGDFGITAGWGQTEFGGPMSSKLVRASLPILSNMVCMNSYQAITDQMLCAGFVAEGGVDSCTGDGGGPLMCLRAGGYFSLDGVSSFGKGCGLQGYPGVYSRVCQVRSWIDSYIANDIKFETSQENSPYIYGQAPSEPEPYHYHRSFRGGLSQGASDGKEECGQPMKFSNKVTSAPTDFPWHVFIYLYVQNRDGYDSCGGVVVSNSWVLTAAHCCQQVQKPMDIIVDFSGDGTSTRVGAPTIAFFIHPDYHPATTQFDFCLLKVQVPSSMQFMKQLSPVCLPRNCESSCKAGDSVIVASWGHKTSVGNHSSFLHKSVTTIHTSAYCTTALGAIYDANKTCVIKKAIDNTCSSAEDHAMILLCPNVETNSFTIAGISSIGNCVSPTSPLFFNQVCSVRPWIASTISEYQDRPI